MARRYANAKNTSTFSPETSAMSTPTMAGGTQAVGTEVGYAGSFTPQMSAPITFSVQGGGAVGAGKTVRGSRLGRGGPELTRPVSGNVTMGNVSISSTMSPTFSNIGNVDASVKGVTGGTQTQKAPVFTGVGEAPRMAGVGKGKGGESVGPRPKGFDLSSYDVTSQGGKGFGLKDIEYLRSQGVTDKQLKQYAKGLGADVNVGNVAREQLGIKLKTPSQQVPYAPGVTPPKQTKKQPTASVPGDQSIVTLLPPTVGSTPTSFLPPGTSPTGPYAPRETQKTSTKTQKQPEKAASAKAKAQLVKAKEAVKTAKETPKEDRTRADRKALEAAKAKLQLERLQAEKTRAERTKQEQRAVAEAKAKAKAAAEAAAKAKAKAQAAKKSKSAKTSKKK